MLIGFKEYIGGGGSKHYFIKVNEIIFVKKCPFSPFSTYEVSFLDGSIMLMPYDVLEECMNSINTPEHIKLMYKLLIED